MTHGGQSEEWNAENGAECGDEFARPRDWHRVTVADRTQRHLQYTLTSQRPSLSLLTSYTERLTDII